MLLNFSDNFFNSANYLRVLDAADLVLEKQSLYKQMTEAIELAISNTAVIDLPQRIQSPQDVPLKLTPDKLWKIKRDQGLLAAWKRIQETIDGSNEQDVWLQQWKNHLLEESRLLLSSPIKSAKILDALEILCHFDNSSKVEMLLNAQIPLIIKSIESDEERWLSMLTGLVRMIRHEFDDDWLSAPSKIINDITKYIQSADNALRRLAQMLAVLSYETDLEGELLEGIAEKIVGMLGELVSLGLDQSFEKAHQLVQAFDPFPIDECVVRLLKDSFGNAQLHGMSLLFGAVLNEENFNQVDMSALEAELEPIPPPRPIIAPLA